MSHNHKETDQKKTVLLQVLPVVITHSTSCTQSHTPQSFTKCTARGRLRILHGNTLGGIGPARTTAERAAVDITLVRHYPSRQAACGLPGTSHQGLGP